MRRHDVRLKAFDYRSPGIYLVTLVTTGRERCLAAVRDAAVSLTPFGNVVTKHLGLLPGWRPQVIVIDHIIMPDHVHILLRFVEEIPAGLGGVVGCLKAGITREVNVIRGTPADPFWQPNYWERVVRSETELRGYQRYFADNPRRWAVKYGSSP
jgi:putative transposase